jgi:hypothetical protein
MSMGSSLIYASLLSNLEDIERWLSFGDSISVKMFKVGFSILLGTTYLPVTKLESLDSSFESKMSSLMSLSTACD